MSTYKNLGQNRLDFKHHLSVHPKLLLRNLPKFCGAPRLPFCKYARNALRCHLIRLLITNHCIVLQINAIQKPQCNICTISALHWKQCSPAPCHKSMHFDIFLYLCIFLWFNELHGNNGNAAVESVYFEDDICQHTWIQHEFYIIHQHFTKENIPVSRWQKPMLADKACNFTMTFTTGEL